jgi:redox-sensitive bicupin YhaK (pirin superfamily)
MQTLAPRATDLGALTVQRLLPQRPRRMVGAWCFLDLFGPVSFEAAKPMDVAPHPHAGLQTVTWLLEGEALHKDSLDSEALARPGTLNLMTSGQGVAHSEETPADHSRRLHGVQLWIALPEADRHGPAAFDHHAERPRVEESGWRATVVLGRLAGVHARARLFSPVVAAEVIIDGAAEATIPLDPTFEHALLPLHDGASVEGEVLAAQHLHYFEPGREALPVRGAAAGPTRALLIGGAPFGEEILMWWNFVARTTEEIVAMREDWQAGRRFGEVHRYGGPRLEAPPFKGRPVPANPMS